MATLQLITKLNTRLVSASYLEMYAIGCISKSDLEYILKRSFKSLTQEELDYINHIKKTRGYSYRHADGGLDLGHPLDVQVDIQTEDLTVSISIYNKYFK